MKKRIFFVISPLVLFLVFILSTDPRKISLIAVLVPFIFLGIAFYNLLMIGLDKLTKVKRLRLLSLVGTIILMNFILLSSIGQLTIQDTILALLITLVGGFYLYKFQIS